MGPIDLLVVGWCLFLAGVYWLGVEGPVALSGAGNYLGVAAAILALAAVDDRLPAPLRLLRRTYPLWLLAHSFLDICRLTGLLHPVYLDPEVREFERQLFFGVEPAWALRAAFPHPWVNELIHALYFSYFPIIAFSGLLLELRSRPHLYRLQFRIAVTWIAASLIYLSFPVAGPHALRGDDYAQPTLFVGIMDAIYAGTHHSGGALPSSHVAIAWTCWASVRSWSRRAAWIVVPFALGVTVSTVYCRYHYAIDVFAGILFVAATVRLADRLYPVLDPAALFAPGTAPAQAALRVRSGLLALRRRIGGTER